MSATTVGLHRRPEPALAASARATVALVGWCARAVVLAALVAVGVGFLALAIGPRTGAYRTVTMLTGSMSPTMPVGAVLVVRPQSTAQLRVGQVLTYAIPVQDHRVVSHRVVSVHPSPHGGVVVQTKGDANPGVDPWTATITDARVWTVRASVPHLGAAILRLRDPAVRPAALYLLPGLCALWCVAGSWRRT